MTDRVTVYHPRIRDVSLVVPEGAVGAHEAQGWRKTPLPNPEVITKKTAPPKDDKS